MGYLEIWLILQLVQEIHVMVLEHQKESSALKQNKIKYNDGVYKGDIEVN